MNTATDKPSQCDREGTRSGLQLFLASVDFSQGSPAVNGSGGTGAARGRGDHPEKERTLSVQLLRNLRQLTKQLNLVTALGLKGVRLTFTGNPSLTVLVS